MIELGEIEAILIEVSLEVLKIFWSNFDWNTAWSTEDILK